MKELRRKLQKDVLLLLQLNGIRSVYNTNHMIQPYDIYGVYRDGRSLYMSMVFSLMTK
jgi:hypothetical protein